jgi:hypothetical protein
VLFGALQQARAWERLHDPEVLGSPGMKTDNVYEIAKAAGYGEEAAQKFAKDWAWQRSKRDLPY